MTYLQISYCLIAFQGLVMLLWSFARRETYTTDADILMFVFVGLAQVAIIYTYYLNYLRGEWMDAGSTKDIIVVIIMFFVPFILQRGLIGLAQVIAMNQLARQIDADAAERAEQERLDRVIAQQRDNAYVQMERRLGKRSVQVRPALKDARLKWAEFTSVSVEGHAIQSSFLHFPAGTNQYEIWDWFEATYHCSITEDLLYWNRP